MRNCQYKVNIPDGVWYGLHLFDPEQWFSDVAPRSFAVSNTLNSPNTILQLNLRPFMWHLRTTLLDSMNQRWVWCRNCVVWHSEDPFLSFFMNHKWWFKTSECIKDVCVINALYNSWEIFNCRIGQDLHIAYCSCEKWLLRSNQVDRFVLSQFWIFFSQKFPDSQRFLKILKDF